MCGRIAGEKLSARKDSPELREKDREPHDVFGGVGAGGSNPFCSTIQSVSFGTYRRIARNPRACARFAIALGPRERLGRADWGKYGKSYPGSILMGPWMFARTSHMEAVHEPYLLQEG